MGINLQSLTIKIDRARWETVWLVNWLRQKW